MWRMWQQHIGRRTGARAVVAAALMVAANAPADAAGARPGGLRLPRDESGAAPVPPRVPPPLQESQAGDASAQQQTPGSGAGSDGGSGTAERRGLLAQVLDSVVDHSPRQRFERDRGTPRLQRYQLEHTRLPTPDATAAGAGGSVGSDMSGEELEAYLHREFPVLFPSEADIAAQDAAAPQLPPNAWLRFQRYDMSYRDSVWGMRLRAFGTFAATSAVAYGATELLSGPAKRAPYRVFVSVIAGACGTYAYGLRRFFGYERKLDECYRVPPAGENICAALKYARDMQTAQRQADAAKRGKTLADVERERAAEATRPLKYPHLPSFGPFALFNPKPKPLPAPVAGTDRHYEPLSLRTRWALGPAFVFLTGEREQRMCAACDRYRDRIVRDAQETQQTRAKARALGLDARTELLVMSALARKHELRVWVHVDPYGPDTRPWTWRWFAANLNTA